jgi:hypothetical protein
MTTVTATKQMIYSDRNVAQMLLGKLQKREPEAKWTMTKLPQGYQLSRVTVLPAQVIKPLPHEVKALGHIPIDHEKTEMFAKFYGASDEKVAKIMGLDMAHMEPKAVMVENDFSSFMEGVAGVNASMHEIVKKPALGNKPLSIDDYQLTVPFLKETKSWLYFGAPQGPAGVKWVHKNHVKEYKVHGDKVVLTIGSKKAKEIGLVS